MNPRKSTSPESPDLDIASTSHPDVQPISVSAPGRILLLTGTLPGEPGVGGVILSDMIQHMGAEHVCCAWLSDRRAKTDSHVAGLQVIRLERRFDTSWRPVAGVAGEVFSAVAFRTLRPKVIRSWFEVVKSLHAVRPFDLVVAILESNASIQLARLVQERLGLRLRCVVWDDVELFCRHSRLDRWSRRLIHRDFEAVLRASEDVAVICENMQKAYAGRYGISSFVLRHGLDSLDNDAAFEFCDTSVVRIGFAGSITAPDCFAALIRSLDRIDWRINGKEVVVRLMGARYTLNSRRAQRIEFFGWRSVEETARLLQECTILYLPQSFELSSRLFSELSFPTKLSTYVAAGRPILLHAPEYASLSAFWKVHQLGPHCASLEIESLDKSIIEICSSGVGITGKWKQAVEHCATGELSKGKFECGVNRLFSSS